ncbi:ras association domain-containing protein 2-like [Chanos chanos]|uniref:Ras association domain-containing protein 2-like n=1 Tax=Chanos chanos TaxID=29144 RepID=A0A6J2UV63_CHACN|nr:ras association domain-containing protein 2-like [Chanos chanos]
MDNTQQDSIQDSVQVGDNKFVSKSTLLSHLKTYNLYYDGQALQLRHREEEEELIVEGLLNIFWGLRRPIRLQMQDDKEPIRSPTSCTSLHLNRRLGLSRKDMGKPAIQVTAAEEDSVTDGGQAGAEEESSHLLRTRSDVGGRRQATLRPATGQIRRHRCSINGHFYNHKTAVFTPAYGSVTNVRINSSMTTPQVLRVLLNKFKIENRPDEFALFLVHTSGERTELKSGDHPLTIRILQGPCEQVSKIFLMDRDLAEEVTYDVAQYIKFELPVLESFILKLKEEEDREVQKLQNRYTSLRSSIQEHMAAKSTCASDSADGELQNKRELTGGLIMTGRQRLLLLWAWMLLVASLCPLAFCKRGGWRGKGTGFGGKTSTSGGRGSSWPVGKLGQGGVIGSLGGAAVGYGLGSLGRPKYGHGHKADSSKGDKGFYGPGGQGSQNHSSWQHYRGGASTQSAGNALLVVGSAVLLFIGDRIRAL